MSQLPTSPTPPAALQPPRGDGYILLAATISRGNPLLSGRKHRRALIGEISPVIADIAAHDDVLEAVVFEARLVAPGMGRTLLQQRADRVTPADFDLVVLVRTTDPAAAMALRDSPLVRKVAVQLHAAALRTHTFVGHNARRIADVDHTRDSVFLFNYFYADDIDDLLDAWQHTAGWFVAKTHLPDSEVLQPLPGQPDQYGIVNHASWPSYRAFLPHLILRPSFRRFVLATFEANHIAAQPILYRRARIN